MKENNMKEKMIRETFRSERAAEARWDELKNTAFATGSLKDGSGRVVKSEMEYNKDGTFTVIFETR